MDLKTALRSRWSQSEMIDEIKERMIRLFSKEMDSDVVSVGRSSSLMRVCSVGPSA